MKKTIVFIIIVIAIIVLATLFIIKNNSRTDSRVEVPTDNPSNTNVDIPVQPEPDLVKNLTDAEKSIIAHAGGSLYVDDTRYTYSNCYKAIKTSYENGVRLCEIDFLRTVDGGQVAFHSWDGFLTKFFGVESKHDYTHDEFMNFKMVGDAGQLDLDTLIKYMKTDFPELILVTDTKDDNITLLTEIKTKYPEMMTRIIPQVYNQDEYHKTVDLGYENIIYTLYESPDTDEEVVEFCKTNPVFAITMSVNRVTDEFVANLDELGVYVYVHTIDSWDDFEYLANKKVDGIYTNDLYPLK